MRVYRIAPTLQSYISTCTGEGSCKAHEFAHPNRNAGPHFLNLTGYFVNVKLPFTLAATTKRRQEEIFLALI